MWPFDLGFSCPSQRARCFDSKFAAIPAQNQSSSFFQPSIAKLSECTMHLSSPSGCQSTNGDGRAPSNPILQISLNTRRPLCTTSPIHALSLAPACSLGRDLCWELDIPFPCSLCWKECPLISIKSIFIPECVSTSLYPIPSVHAALTI